MFRSYWIKFRCLFIYKILCWYLTWFMPRLSLLNTWNTIWITNWKIFNRMIMAISWLCKLCLIWRILSLIHLWWMHSWWRVYSIIACLWRYFSTSWTCFRPCSRSSTRSSSWAGSITFPRSTLLFNILMQLRSLIYDWFEIIFTFLVYHPSLSRLIWWGSCSWWLASWRLSSFKTQLFSATIIHILESP